MQEEPTIIEWGVRSQNTKYGNKGTATYGPYSSIEAAEEIRDTLIEGDGWLIWRRVTEWAKWVEL